MQHHHHHHHHIFFRLPERPQKPIELANIKQQKENCKNEKIQKVKKMIFKNIKEYTARPKKQLQPHEIKSYKHKIKLVKTESSVPHICRGKAKGKVDHAPQESVGRRVLISLFQALSP